MLPEVLVGLVSSTMATYAYDSLKEVLRTYLAKKKIKIEAKNKEDLVFELTQKAEQIRAGESPEEASISTKNIIEDQVSFLDKEAERLASRAKREHWVGLGFTILFGLIFCTAIVLLIKGTLTQAIVTFLGSAVPGFLSRVFRVREKEAEKDLKSVRSDFNNSKKVKERLFVLEKALAVIPIEYQKKVVDEFSKKIFED